jgi:hypothetical protein
LKEILVSPKNHKNEKNEKDFFPKSGKRRTLNLMELKSGGSVVKEKFQQM